MARRKTPDVMGEVLGEARREPAADSPPAAPMAEVSSPAGPAARAVGREAEAKRVIHNHAVWASAIGLLPMPVLDVIALTALQVRMLSLLARTYEIEFAERSARATIAAVTSSNVADILHRGAVGSFLRAIPGFGWIAGVLFMPAASAAVTYAVGGLFAQHFAAGGTFFDVDLDEWKGSYKRQYQQGLAMFRKQPTDGSDS